MFRALLGRHYNQQCGEDGDGVLDECRRKVPSEGSRHPGANGAAAERTD